jgi:anhydro-N-acetylmuramic acid kinase
VNADLANADGEVLLVGLMSGTSLDGISAAVVGFREADGRVHATVHHFASRAYPPASRARLAAAMQSTSAQEYCRLHSDLGQWLGEAARDAMRAAGVSARDVHAVASHGQTLWHEPGHSTWQIGDAARIAEITGCAVITDFRTRDMAVGGQGAPLVPMADLLLFAHDTDWRALQNIGGIGNVTLVPPRSLGDTEPVRAFDTGPGVVVIDGVVQRLFGVPFDRDAHIARRGRVIEAVVQAHMQLSYLSAPPPKSTGRELFTPTFIDAFIAAGRAAGASDADIVATACAYTAETIADQYLRWLPVMPADAVVSGGGARHPFLLHRLHEALTRHAAWHARQAPAVRHFDALFFDAEAKEAVAFALLGYLHLTGRPGNVPSATGARVPRVLGALTPVAKSELS